MRIPHARIDLRTVRLASGLVLFAYAACHFATHATGLLLFGVMEMASAALLAPWRLPPGQALLYGSLAAHAGLGLHALWRRRHLAMPAAEAWQTLLGLAIPVLLLVHIVDVRVAAIAFGVDDSYERMILRYWVDLPWVGAGLALLLVAVWVHGCLGLHLWLRGRPWYALRFPALLSGAVLLPVLALLGLVNAGFDLGGRVLADPEVRKAIAVTSGGPDALQATWLDRAALAAAGGWLLLTGSLVLARAARGALARRRAPVVIGLPQGLRVVVPRGTTVLEASRLAGAPLRALCGGKARCTTCRVRVLRGLEGLPGPTPAEAAALARVSAGPGERLACQLHPVADVAVAPLLPVGRAPSALDALEAGAREAQVVAMAVDLRGSTAMAASALPWDALFVVDRYVQTVFACVEAEGGTVVSVAGDGVMAAFGLDAEEGPAAAAALRAVLRLVVDLDRLAAELRAAGLPPAEGLRAGIGVATGVAVVGALGPLGHRSIQFLGDVGNLASRLETETKRTGAAAHVQRAVVELAGAAVPGAAPVRLELRGWPEPVEAFALLRAGTGMS